MGNNYYKNFIPEDNIIIYTFLSILFSFIMMKMLSIFSFSDNKNSNKYSPNIKNKLKENSKIKIGLLTNEIPPIVYGGVATWIINFLDMFKDDDEYDIIPIYLAYQDYPPEDFKKYNKLRVIYYPNDIKECFNDIDICINNIWISLDTIKKIRDLYPSMTMISVCHSLIQMEHKTNLGNQYQITWEDQEITFKNSDFVVLISESEKEHYINFNYDNFKATPVVIYNSYKPKFDKEMCDVDYNLDNPGYIGRHVPRKRPELPLFAVKNSNRDDIQVYNMGVDYKNGSNLYWDRLDNKNKQLNIIPFTSDKKEKERYWKSIGVNCITGIYEPFGYTICETLDRRVPCIVQNIGGPSEIIKDYKEDIITYEVSMDFDKDVNNFQKALELFWKKTDIERKEMSEKSRKALNNFRPEIIKRDWKKLLSICNNFENHWGRFSNKLLNKKF